jgi:phosphonate transport system ATP-binding protein
LGPVNLELVEGQKTAIIGPSGAGKTTLLRLLAVETEPTSGTIECEGKPIDSFSRNRKYLEVGLMHQQLDLVPQLSARKNIEAGNSGRWSIFRTLASLLLPVHDNASHDVAEAIGIAEYLNDRTSVLSGGQQQRVALCRLLVQSPKLHLADEPVSSLDPVLTDKVLKILCGIHELPGCHVNSVVANLHSPDLAIKHFDRIIGLHDGTIRFDKPATQVTEDDVEFTYEDESDIPRVVDPSPNIKSNWGRH